MDIHPWTNYEIARLQDEERLARAREAMLARELRGSEADDVGSAVRMSSRLAWLRRRGTPTEQPTVGPRAA